MLQNLFDINQKKSNIESQSIKKKPMMKIFSEHDVTTSIKCVGLSMLGVFLFMFPIEHLDRITIPVAVMAKTLNQAMASKASFLMTMTLFVSAIGALWHAVFKPQFMQKTYLKVLFVTTPLWLCMRILAASFALVIAADLNIPMINSANTGQLVLHELLPLIFCVFLFAGTLLPFLINFGLLEFLGTLLTKIMRPLFNLPGRSAIDCITSWLGDCSVAIMLTSKQFEEGHYTEKEAAIVGTSFSAVSISFALIIISEVGLAHRFMPFYCTVILVGVVCAFILPRIPPLSWKSDRTIDGKLRLQATENHAAQGGLMAHGLRLALRQAEQSPSIRKTLQDGVINSIEMMIAVLPVIMSVGTLAIVIAEHTSVFNWLSLPFVPVFEWLQIPQAEHAAKSLVLGFTDMFIPALISTQIDSELTRFVVATLSVCQLIYMSEVGALLLASKIPIKFWELCVLFSIRTAIAVPIICGVGHLLF
jgi:nucleoside recognition membrane protein YjiH